MAPDSAAVEIDPRLLRQLEEEYEALKNDSSGASRFRDETRPSSRPRPHAEIASSLGSRANAVASVRFPHPRPPPSSQARPSISRCGSRSDSRKRRVRV